MRVTIGDVPTRGKFNALTAAPREGDPTLGRDDCLGVKLDLHQRQYSWINKNSHEMVVRNISNIADGLMGASKTASNQITRRTIRRDLWKLLTNRKRDHGFGIARARARQLLEHFDHDRAGGVMKAETGKVTPQSHYVTRSDLVGIKSLADAEAVSNYGRVIRKIQDWKDQWEAWRQPAVAYT